MAKTPRTVHLRVQWEGLEALEAAVQRAERAQKALESITQCPSTHPTSGLQCELVEHHQEMAGTRHRAKSGSWS